MEVVFKLQKHSDSEFFIYLSHCFEYWPAKFHASLQNACAIVADYPFRSLRGVRFGSYRRRVGHGNLVKAETNFSILADRDTVKFSKVRYMRRRKRFICLKTVEECNYPRNVSMIDGEFQNGSKCKLIWLEENSFKSVTLNSS